MDNWLIFKKINVQRKKTKTIIWGLDKIGLIFLLYSQGLISLIVLGLLSFTGWKIGWLDIETWVIIFFTVTVQIFSPGYCIVISKQQLKFYRCFCFLPVLRFKEKLENIEIKKHHHYRYELDDKTIIAADSDAWAEMGFSDWVSIKKGKKEFDFGGNSNYKQLLEEISTSIEYWKEQ